MANRPTLPRPLVRQIKVEAGYRCAIPTCHEHPVEMAHIEPRKPDGSNDVFDNLIALCPTCHSRYDRGEIDRLAMRQYKENLTVLNSRYGELEKRLLQQFADEPQYTVIDVPGGFEIMYRHLLEDGLIRIVDHTEVKMPQATLVGVPTREYLGVTQKGLDFIARWLQAEDLEET